ncbi:uncharacterized protein [Haliaeetus albicilla]|uniref:uncharacterized protein isoform X2 n=1 Tax=Haliaeetus albicilla TaxID=8969 RepID=UPI0037E798B1
MSQLPKGRITPGAKPRGGGRQLSFPRLWCHLPASAALQVSAEALITTAELLKWKELKHLVQTQQTWRTGECLLVQDRSRAEEYLSQSLPYLGDAQATLREVAVRFIGEPQPPGSLFWQSPSCPARGLSLPLPPLPTQVGLVAALRSPTPLGYWSSLGSALARGRRACSPGGRAGAVLLGACWGAGGLTTLCA